MRTKIPSILLVCVLIGLMTACGGGGSQSNQSAGEGSMGKPVTVKDVVVTLNSATVAHNKVLANFTVENKGTADLAIDPATTFLVDAVNGDEKIAMSVDPTSCKATAIKGPIPAGGKATGDVCWRSDPTLTWPGTAKISYGGAAGSPDAVFWTVEAEIQ